MTESAQGPLGAPQQMVGPRRADAFEDVVCSRVFGRWPAVVSLLVASLLAPRACAFGVSPPRRRPKQPQVVTRIKSSVNDYVGNQHGGKYNFGAGPDAQAAAGADYSRGLRPKTTTEDPDLAEEDDPVVRKLLDAARDEAEVSSEPPAWLFEDAEPAAFDEEAGVFVVAVENAAPTWARFGACLLGPNAAAFCLRPSDVRGTLAPRAATMLRCARRTDDDDVVRRSSDDGTLVVDTTTWAALVVATDEGERRAWRLL